MSVSVFPDDPVNLQEGKNVKNIINSKWNNSKWYLPFAMLHHGNVTYVKNAFNGTDC